MKILEAIKSVNYKDLLSRALWTFLQAFLAVILIGLEPIIDTLFNGDWRGLVVATIALGAAAIAAGISALKTFVLAFIKELQNKAE